MHEIPAGFELFGPHPVNLTMKHPRLSGSPAVSAHMGCWSVCKIFASTEGTGGSVS